MSGSGGSGISGDATTTQTSLWKNSATSTFGGASYTVATTSGSITDTYTTAASSDWVMAAIALRPATSTSGTSSTGSTTVRYVHTDHLGGASVLTDATGTVVETLDYYRQ